MAENLPTIVAKHGSDELVRYLQQHGVGFLVVGGTAVAVHGGRDEFDSGQPEMCFDFAGASKVRQQCELHAQQ